MRQAFAHEATLAMDPDADLRAPGGAITVALCGHREHEPPCPLAAHYTDAARVGDEVRVRVLFATEPESEATVRERIDAALMAGELCGPDGAITRWRWRAGGADDVAVAESDRAQRLVRS